MQRVRVWMPLLAACVAALLALAPTAALAGWRLPDEVAPTAYELSLAPDLARETLAGEARIDVQVHAPTRRIILDADQLQVQAALVERDGRSTPARIDVDDEHQQVVLTLPSLLAPGPAVLHLRWTATLRHDLAGLYVVDDGGRRFAFSHFEPAFARRVFPCFDEPRRKTPFRLRVEVSGGDEVLSNAPLERIVDDGPRRRFEFAPTAPLPPHLVALAIGRFDARAEVIAGVPVRLLTVAGRGDGGRALEAIRATLPRLAADLGRPFPYPKLDVVAVPDFAPGGMENAGLIFVRERTLLVDDDELVARRAMELLVAHELAHQWLGDLVSLDDWRELWLYEGLATTVSHALVDELHPERQLYAELAQRQDDALLRDALPGAHPLAASVTTPAEASARFDEITYEKGASVLLMVERWVGRDRFRAGLRRFLVEHAGKSAGPDELWQAIGDETLAGLADRWLHASGHPLLDVTARCDGTRLRLTMRQRPDGSDDDGVWPLPLVLDVDGTPTRILFRRRSGEAWLERSDHCPRFAVERAPLFARVSLHGEPSLPPADDADAVARLDDLWAEVTRGERSASSFFVDARPLLAPLSRARLAALLPRLRFAADELVSPGERDAFAAWLAGWLAPLATSPHPAQNDEQRLLASELSTTLALLAKVTDRRASTAMLDRLLAPGSRASDTLLALVHALEGPPPERRLAWGFFVHHFPTIVQKLPRSGYGELVRATASFCDDRARREVAWFFAAPDHRPPAASGSVRASEQEIASCAALRRREAPRFSAWLQSLHGAVHGRTTERRARNGAIRPAPHRGKRQQVS